VQLHREESVLKLYKSFNSSLESWEKFQYDAQSSAYILLYIYITLTKFRRTLHSGINKSEVQNIKQNTGYVKGCRGRKHIASTTFELLSFSSHLFQVTFVLSFDWLLLAVT